MNNNITEEKKLILLEIGKKIERLKSISNIENKDIKNLNIYLAEYERIRSN